MFALLEAFFTQYGYAAVFFVLVVCGFGVPIPEDITLVAGGVISGLGYANVHIMFLVGMVGVLVGDGLMFTAGRVFGHKILKVRFVARVMTPKRYAQVQEKFDKYGNRVLFTARFLPGLRTPIYITAGISRKVSYLRFLIMDGLAALISVPVWVYLGNYGAENTDWLLEKVHQFQAVLFVLLGIGAVVLLYFWWKKRQRLRFYREHLRELRAKRKERKAARKAGRAAE
ncbi:MULTISPECIES: DedA family protein [unclassified Neisseria]|uniref:DedA family protein n=1 Tax=unclassified Neisseria TaxID=2623750 RepID=UPI0026669AA2|nr:MULTISPECIES: DedA family protein [unclassified Neisseria]MDO1508797.1 DedA family protein [Neisseria sp. MVDL19-042950]MDO1515056.1 DedA family protein [Neisseria sp. MVDL18-041461]MDO1562416.1 DedA family protein [Neisseria sp. MVDL20-010259]